MLLPSWSDSCRVRPGRRRTVCRFVRMAVVATWQQPSAVSHAGWQWPSPLLPTVCVMHGSAMTPWAPFTPHACRRLARRQWAKPAARHGCASEAQGGCCLSAGLLCHIPCMAVVALVECFAIMGSCKSCRGCNATIRHGMGPSLFLAASLRTGPVSAAPDRQPCAHRPPHLPGAYSSLLSSSFC